MPQKPLIDVQFHGHITCCEFLDRQLTARSDLLVIFKYLNQRVVTHPEMELILDFKNVNHISSIFIGHLMELGHLVRQHGGKLILAQINNQVYEILELTHTNRYFVVHRMADEDCNPVSRLHELRKASGEEHPTMITRIMSMVHHMHMPDLFSHHSQAQQPQPQHQHHR